MLTSEITTSLFYVYYKTRSASFEKQGLHLDQQGLAQTASRRGESTFKQQQDISEKKPSISHPSPSDLQQGPPS
jgi:hypothetical protein